MNRNGDQERLVVSALKPAEVRKVLLYKAIRRAVVLVREDQLALAIGRRGEKVRLASTCTGWDIEIMTAEEFDEQIERARLGFRGLPGVSDRLALQLIEQGYLWFDDLALIEPDALKDMGAMTEQQANFIIEQAEQAAEIDDRR
jgi:N utilization substance protein A